MSASRAEVAAGMQWNAYALLNRAVEEGLSYGWQRAHKHTEDPEFAAILEAQRSGIMEALCEILHFPETE